jgi:RHS repeat-associated protein
LAIYTYSVNRLTTVNGQAYTWDANGNLLNDGSKSYTYDQANRLITVTATSLSWSASYNGDGARLRQVTNGVPTTYTLDLAAGLVQVLVQQDTTGATRYLYGVTRIGEEQPGGWAYHLTDALGSVRQLADGSAQVTLARGYMPYGEPLWSVGSGSSVYGYTGEDWNTTTQLVFLRARYMQPALGIFVSRDPWQGNARRPLSLQGFNYAYDNPCNKFDHSGRMPTWQGIENGDYSFSCKCGWIDWKHAIPTNARELIKAVRAQVDGGANDYKAVLAKEYGLYNIGVSEYAIVRKDLPPDRQEASAVGIFMEISEEYEELQGSYLFGIPGRDSYYSLEDLPSNLIGFYTALASEAKGTISDEDQKAMIKPICGAKADDKKDKEWSKQAFLYYQRTGLLYQKNHEWHPSVYPAVFYDTDFACVAVGGCPGTDRPDWPWQFGNLETIATHQRRGGDWWWWSPSIDGFFPGPGESLDHTFIPTSVPYAYAFNSPNYPGSHSPR